MNLIIYSIAILLFIRVSAIEELKRRRGDFESVNGPQWIPQPVGGDGLGNQINSTTYTSVNHYYCAADDIEDQVLILYGTKSWTFPIQDVNLTLSYPTDNLRSQFNSDEEGYIITGFRVVLYVDGLETRGYITEGGVLQDSLILTFVSQSIASLSYEFWLFGTPKYDLNSSIFHDLSIRFYECT